ncbi:hypothetical protein [Arthrobacter sp. SAFR-044]|uniref:hypothetical protein n=1 Tax=Arthrobacter sp. SAFR-044 TaxID=3387278 RepID=UPI003F7B4785
MAGTENLTLPNEEILFPEVPGAKWAAQGSKSWAFTLPGAAVAGNTDISKGFTGGADAISLVYNRNLDGYANENLLPTERRENVVPTPGPGTFSWSIKGAIMPAPSGYVTDLTRDGIQAQVTFVIGAAGGLRTGDRTLASR